MKTITVAGKDCRCTLSDRFRRHTPEEADRLRESVREDGVLHAAVLYDDTDLDVVDCVLDGEGRLGAVADLAAAGVSVALPTRHDGRMTTEEAYRRALAFNDHRRHDNPAAIEQRRAERIRRVAEMRSAGMSIRGIAAEANINPKQVQRDLRAAGVDSVHTSVPAAPVHSVDTCPPPRLGADEPAPDRPAVGVSDRQVDAGESPPVPLRVTGRDGKSYPAPPAPVPAPRRGASGLSSRTRRSCRRRRTTSPSK